MAAMICTRLDEEFGYITDPVNVNLDVFGNGSRSDSHLSIAFKRLRRFLSHKALFDTETLRNSVRQNLGDVTFLEAYNRTRRILNITVSSNTMYEMPRLLNYLTSPNVVGCVSNADYMERCGCILCPSCRLQIGRTPCKRQAGKYYFMAS
jgi:predicted acylesterase/phospholipase RssA